MTKPDLHEALRNRTAPFAIVLGSLSIGAAWTAGADFAAILDYWLVAASVISGVGAIAFGIATFAHERERLDALRTN